MVAISNPHFCGLYGAAPHRLGEPLAQEFVTREELPGQLKSLYGVDKNTGRIRERQDSAAVICCRSLQVHNYPHGAQS